MKHLLIFISILGALNVNSQIRVVKLNPVSAAFGAASLSFERVWDKQYSLNLTATYRPDIKGPDLLFTPSEEGWSLKGSQSTMWGGQIAYRWYTRKGRTQPAKPFFALFGQHHQWQARADYQEEQNTYRLNGEWNQTTVGLQYGVQWVIRDAFSIDLTLVGFGLAFGQLEGTGQTQGEPNIGLWEENLGAIPLIGQRILMRGTDSFYEFGENYRTIGLHSAIRVGVLF